MKFLIVVAFIALAQADRDLSKFAPKARVVFPDAAPPTIPRIVNGEEADHHQFPYMAALFIDGGSFCGGSILKPNKILTAAHCCDGSRSIEVVVGGHNIEESEETQQSILSSNIEVHESWDPFSVTNDVCVITLQNNIKIDGVTTQTISLYKGDDTHVGATAVVSGWGKPSDSSGGISPVLRHVSETIISNSECKTFFSIIKDSNICLNGSNAKSSCSGDSGGPLVVDGKEVGVVSFGSAFGCSIGFPSAYARVSHFHDWINGKA